MRVVRARIDIPAFRKNVKPAQPRNRRPQPNRLGEPPHPAQRDPEGLRALESFSNYPHEQPSIEEVMIEPTLESERLVLEPLVAAHASLMYPDLLDVELYRYISDDPPISEEWLAQRYRRLESRQSPDGRQQWLNWAIRDEGSSYVGYVQATVTGPSALVAYVIFRRAQRHGYAREALRCVLEHLARSGV
jgi:RimJ/RimL family protein N-acetyltransferase